VALLLHVIFNINLLQHAHPRQTGERRFPRAISVPFLYD
jgi:hypothetical protein